MFDSILLEKALRQAVATIDGSVMKEGEFYFACPICGDSQRNKSIKRGHLKLRHDGMDSFWYYRCFNGDCPASAKAWSAENWLKEMFPVIHKSYVRDLLKNHKKSDVDEMKRINEALQKQNDARQLALENKKREAEKEAVKFFVPIMSDKAYCKGAVELCVKRGIPKKIYKKFFVANNSKDEKNKYRGRMIIPFYDNNNKIYYYQARAMDKGNSAKYINRTTNKDNGIYNIHNVDRTKPVCILEGPIDSMFIENSIATLGVGINDLILKKLEGMECFFLMDNDEAGRILSEKLLLDGNYVFLWTDFIKDYDLPTSIKDINDCYLKLNRKEIFKFDELKKYFTNDFYDKVKL